MTSRCRMSALLLATSALVVPALARAATPAPTFVSVDDHAVDLTSGLPYLSIEEGSVGSGKGAVSLQRIYAGGAGVTDNWVGGLYQTVSGGTSKITILFAGISDTFTLSGSTWTSDKGDGATLTSDANGFFTYTNRDGVVYYFDKDRTNNDFYTNSCPGAADDTCQIPLSITSPDGQKFTYTWTTQRVCQDPPECGFNIIYKRLSKIASSAGYSVSFTYASNTPGSSGYFQRTVATFDNSASPITPARTVTYAYPNATTTNVTDPLNRTWVFTTDASQRLTGVKRPGSASNNLSYGYGADGTVNSATKDGVTNSYARSVVGSTATETVTDPLSNPTVVISDLSKSRMTSYKDPLNRTTAYQYDASARLTRITKPEGNYTSFGYDARGNVTTITNVAKAGSGLANIVSSASYDATCANIVKCNKPNTTTDPKANVTNYIYDPTHGGVTSVKRPAPVTGGIRPETRYTYTQVTSASTALVYMLTKVAACQTTATCTNLADETQVTAAYNSNLLPTTVTRRNGTGTLTSTNTLSYNPPGTVNTVNGPLTGTADTVKYRYDAADQLIGVTSPDPDGAGTMKMRAIRLTYRPDGQVSKQELGTVNSQSDPDWALFVPLQTVDITFDANSRPATRKLSASGTNYALTQTSYDADGRLDCSAVRMNTAVYGSLPASACTLSTQGADGPDRITQTVYDAADQVTQNRQAVGTTDAATERTLTWSNNGLLATLKDGENNLTTYEYDGFDRLSKTRFPSMPKGAGTSSTTDYEQLLSYDANSNPGSRRLRDGQSIAYTYDKLDRVTLKNLPGAEPDVTYAYDNLDRLTSASQTGNALSFGWDALSRNLTQAGPQGTASYQYDAADRRTQLTYPGTGLFVNTDYLVTGEVTKIRENGATTGVGVLATYAYDNLGNRLSTTFGDGAVQAFTYDPVSRLATLNNDLTGTANDLTATFAHNPASQLTQTVRTGDSYAWTGHFNENKTGTANGLNQLTAYGSKNLSYDGKGNVTAFGTETFGYSSENLLTSGPNSTTIAYDPAMRLYQTVSGTTTTRFAYDGVQMIAEHNASNALQRRFVFGPGVDAPIVWYEGTGTTNRRFLGSDERGSVISVTDSAGTLLGVNSYDEFGQPQSTNLGRFGYTGQAWLPEVGLNYYKARVYEPEIGRFLQTDPIKYGSGLNLYYYVGNDPINWSDPTGEFFPVVGFAFGAGLEVGLQLAEGTASGQTLGEAWSNINWGQVLVSGALGTFPGLGFVWAGATKSIRLLPRLPGLSRRLYPTLSASIKLNKAESRVVAGIGALGIALRAGIKHQIGIGAGPRIIGLGNSTLFLPPPVDLSQPATVISIPVLVVGQRGRYEEVYDQNGNLVGYRDTQTGEIIPVDPPEDDDTAPSSD